MTKLASRDRGLPPDEEINALPRWACVAFVVRSARRVHPLILACWHDASESDINAYEWALREAELSAEQGMFTANVDDAFEEAYSVTAGPPHAESQAFFAVWRVMRSLDTNQSAIWALRSIESVAYSFEQDSRARGVRRSILSRIQADLELLREHVAKSTADVTGVSQSLFGPMWPKHQPTNWPKTDTPAFRQPSVFNPPVESLGLPQEVIDDLTDGVEFKWDRDGKEVREVELKATRNLRVRDFGVRTEGSPHSIDDPNNCEGYYLLRVIDIIQAATGYDPDGLLAWFCDYKKFGCYDTDHRHAWFFPRANWNAITDNPSDYIQSQWNPNSRLKRSIDDPWDYCDWVEDD